MNTISDNDLILYFYRDGLDAGRIREIDDALFASPDLRARYTAAATGAARSRRRAGART
jgi:hypothetical protein